MGWEPHWAAGMREMIVRKQVQSEELSCRRRARQVGPSQRGAIPPPGAAGRTGHWVWASFPTSLKESLQEAGTQF